MLPSQPSRTLLVPTVARAAHQLFDAPLILDDPIVVDLVPETSRAVLLDAAEKHRTEAANLFRSLFTLRSRFAEDRLEAAAARGVCQYVMLGAGLETFPWRQPEYARGMRVFFSDHPSTLVWARARFRERRLSVPSNLAFVPADLEEEGLGQRLASAGFSPEVPTFVSVMGVTQYLTGRAVDALLAFFALLHPGSEAVFSFVVNDDELRGLDLAEVHASVERGDDFGEPWLTRFEPTAMIEHVRRFGFRDIFYLGPELAQRLYFAGRRDRLAAPRRERLVAATV